MSIIIQDSNNSPLDFIVINNNSFFNTLIAYKLLVVFSSANITLPKLPFPSTAKKLKSSRPTFRFFATCGGGGGGGGCCCDSR